MDVFWSNPISVKLIKVVDDSVNQLIPRYSVASSDTE